MPFTIHRKRTHHRSKLAFLMAEDYRELSGLLETAFPEARYFMDPTRRQTNAYYPFTGEPLRTQPPRVLIHRSLHRISEAAYHWNADIVMAPDTEWQPTWKHVRDHKNYPHWSLLWPRHPFVLFMRRLGQFHQLKNGVTCLADHRISVHCQPGNDVHLRFANRFFRLFGKIASDRNLTTVKYPSGEIVETHIDKTAWRWVGRAARQWAAGDSNRFVDFNSLKNTGLRPLPVNSSEN